MGRVSARSSFMQRSSCYGSPVGIETVRCENAAQVALHAAIRPLLRLEDGHVLATLSAIVLALCEGRTGLAISGVFGAGETRSAAVLLAGLLVFDPSLKLMVLTKENIAAHAVAEHLVSLQMPDFLQEKMGRLVGYYEQNRKGSYTPLDILFRTGTRSSDKSHSLLDAAVGFNKNAVSNLALWLTGWVALICSWRMRDNNTAIWKRLPRWQEPQLHA